MRPLCAWRRARTPARGSPSSPTSGGRSRSGSPASGGGRRPRTPASTATRSARSRPPACPRCSPRTCPTRWSGSCGGFPAPTGPSRAPPRPPPSAAAFSPAPKGPRAPPAPSPARYGVDFSPVLKALEVSGDLVRGELRPGGTQREWCDPEVLRRLRRASLAALRKEIEPADQRALARFLPNWQGVDRHTAAGAGADRLREVLIGLQGLALPAEVWERDVLPRRVGAYSPSWMDMLCAAGELVWIGAGPLGRRSGKVALYFREDVRLLGPPPPPKEAPSGRAQDAIRERLATGACFFTDLLADIGGIPSEGLQEALWDLVGAGEGTDDAYAPLRSPRPSAPWAPPARADR